MRNEEKNMLRLIVAIVSLGFCSVAAAQLLTLADVKAKNGVQLSAEELKQLMPGAKVISRTQAGSTRSWTNGADGTFVASFDGRGFAGGKTIVSTGAGTWRVADNGRLCMAIKWNVTPEDWCRVMFKVGDKYYGVGRLDDNAPASEFEFSK
ncbi:MAG TPA: DUF995 domain-containing protein [Casimicrobiaceae bacterium]|nr:DUF995 domain-containing protein [Casimicrobiaceae bacterium]